MAELLNAKVGTGHNHCEAGQQLGLLPDAAWALGFDSAGGLLS